MTGASCGEPRFGLPILNHGDFAIIRSRVARFAERTHRCHAIAAMPGVKVSDIRRRSHLMARTHMSRKSALFVLAVGASLVLSACGDTTEDRAVSGAGIGAA